MSKSTLVPYEYLQETAHDCGPKALGFAAKLSPAQIEEAWGIDDIKHFSDILDSPWHHEVVLWRLDKTFELITLERVLAGDYAQNSCVVLIHSPDNPETAEPESLTRQHWVVVQRVIPFEGSRAAVVNWGDGKIYVVRESAFAAWYARGTPACAYLIHHSPGPVPAWYKRLWVWFTHMIFGG